MAGGEGLAGSVNLETLVASVGTLEPEIAVYVARELYANVRRGQHGGIAPSRVRVTRKGRVLLKGPISALSAYTAPEAVRGGRVGPSADVYGLGVCLYFMLTGEPPFNETTEPGALVERILGEGVPRLAGDPQVSVWLAAVVDGLTQWSPARRPDAHAVLPPLSEEHRAHCVLRLAALVNRCLPPATPGSDLPPEPPTQPQPLSLSDTARRLVLDAMTPDTALSRQREAVAQVLRGEYREAAETLAAAARVCEAALGPSHPTTLTSRYWHAVCLAGLGAGGEALVLFATINEHAEQGRTGERG